MNHAPRSWKKPFKYLTQKAMNVRFTMTESKLQMLRFCIVGVLAVAIQYAVYRLMLPWIHVDISFVASYVVSFLFNYVMTTLYTFRVRLAWTRFMRFSLTHCFNFFLQWFLLHLFIYIGVKEQWAPIPMYAISVPTNFILVRLSMLLKK